jgi:dTDP-4-amino-4,6-dideoxygalactose transaminase
MTHIPYIDFRRQHLPIRDEILSAIGRVIDHAGFILGEEVEQFEKEIAGYCGTKYAVGVNSGTDALFLSLKAYGIGQGDEVITVPNSFLATTSVIVAVGARPVFVDVADDMNINPELIEEKLTTNTRAIMPVHLTGRPVDTDPIVQIAMAHNLVVIEDAAQAIGAEYKGRKVGSLGDAGCFSLHPLKTLNACGDGGVITTNNESLYGTLIQLRNIGLKNRNESDMWGYNSRLDTLQAAILLVKLKYLDLWIEQRRSNAEYYIEHFSDVVATPVDRDSDRSAFHTFIIRTEKRDELQEYLERNGIGTRIHYPIPIHLQAAAQSLGYKKGDFPVCERQAHTILSLPIYQGLTEAELAYIVDRIKSFFRRKVRDISARFRAPVEVLQHRS